MKKILITTSVAILSLFGVATFTSLYAIQATRFAVVAAAAAR